MTTTETPMRERIARALATQIDCETEWDTLTLAQENWIFELADAVLDALREPDPFMRLQATRYWTNPGASWSQDGSIICWRVMIDAAKEGK